MLLEQNLFSIYRLIIKTPKIIFLLTLIALAFILVTQVIYAVKINRSIDLRSVLKDYIIAKHEQRQASQNQSLDSNKTNFNESQNNWTDFTSIKYQILNDATILHFRERNRNNMSVQLNYTKDKTLPLVAMIKNHHLTYLGDNDIYYLQAHGIVYDLISIPEIVVEPPFFAFYFRHDMQKNEIISKSILDSMLQLPSLLSQYFQMSNISGQFQEINQLYLNFYYQYGQSTYQSLFNLSQQIYIKNVPNFVLKLFYSFNVLICLMLVSVLIGLIIRYALICLFTIFLVAYYRFFKDNIGWIYQYLNILQRRYRQSRIITLKMGLFSIIASIGMPLLLSFGAYCILSKAVSSAIPLFSRYTTFLMKIIFLIELFHLVFGRTRTTLKFFPIASFIINYCILLICALKKTSNLMICLNISLTLHLSCFIIFAYIEKLIVEQNNKGLPGIFCPTMFKPRLLFYAGYDVSWVRALPPMWTYFTKWFDYSHFNEVQKCLIERDYQLLYGRMLGFNQRQEIPDQEYQLQEIQIPSMREQSNQMNLIQQ